MSMVIKRGCAEGRARLSLEMHSDRMRGNMHKWQQGNSQWIVKNAHHENGQMPNQEPRKAVRRQCMRCSKLNRTLRPGKMSLHGLEAMLLIAV